MQCRRPIRRGSIASCLRQRIFMVGDAMDTDTSMDRVGQDLSLGLTSMRQLIAILEPRGRSGAMLDQTRFVAFDSMSQFSDAL